MLPDNAFSSQRLLLFYKGDISALILFAQQANGSVCFPEPLPVLSSALEPENQVTSKVSLHPGMLLNSLNQRLNLDNDILHIEPGYSEQIDTPAGIVTVHLARFKLLDPPHSMMQAQDCRMRTLPELRRQPPAEMELLRRAYTHLMEG